MIVRSLSELEYLSLWAGISPVQMTVAGDAPPPASTSTNESTTEAEPERPRRTMAADDYSYIAKRIRELTTAPVVEPEKPANPVPVVDYNAYCCD